MHDGEGGFGLDDSPRLNDVELGCSNNEDDIANITRNVIIVTSLFMAQIKARRRQRSAGYSVLQLQSVKQYFKSIDWSIQTYLSTRLKCHIDGVRHYAVLWTDSTCALKGEENITHKWNIIITQNGPRISEYY